MFNIVYTVDLAGPFGGKTDLFNRLIIITGLIRRQWIHDRSNVFTVVRLARAMHIRILIAHGGCKFDSTRPLN